MTPISRTLTFDDKKKTSNGQYFRCTGDEAILILKFLQAIRKKEPWRWDPCNLSTPSEQEKNTTQKKAEAILQQLGIPTSLLTDVLYRQIVIHQRIPFPITLSQKPSKREDPVKDESTTH